MQYTLMLLTAGWLTAQVEPPAGVRMQPPVLGAQAAALEPVPPPPTLRERIRTFFFGPRMEMAPAPAPAMRMPSPVPASAPISSVVPVTTVKTMRPNFDLAEKDLQRVGHEKDYSWITGKLSRASGEPGRWMIHYAGPYEQDSYGGALLLTGPADLANCHEGDLVCIHGKVGTTHPMFGSGAGAVYQVQQLNVIEKAGR
jgi:hypothetical protein